MFFEFLSQFEAQLLVPNDILFHWFVHAVVPVRGERNLEQHVFLLLHLNYALLLYLFKSFLDDLENPGIAIINPFVIIVCFRSKRLYLHQPILDALHNLQVMVTHICHLLIDLIQWVFHTREIQFHFIIIGLDLLHSFSQERHADISLEFLLESFLESCQRLVKPVQFVELHVKYSLLSGE